MGNSRWINCVAAVGYSLSAACQAPAVAVTAPESQPVLSEDLNQAVEERLSSTRPSQQLEALAFLVGDWDLVLENASSSEDSPQVVAMGIAKLVRVLGNRFLEWNAVMHVAGRELASRGLLGYDEPFERYEFLWVSEFSGAQRLARGRGNPLREGLILEYLDNDPASGAQLRRQTLLRIKDTDHFMLEQRGFDGGSQTWLATWRTRYSRRRPSAAQ